MNAVTRTPHPRYPKYLVGDDGTIVGPSGRQLKPWLTKGGYLQVEVGGGRRIKVHVLVCEAFHGARPVGMEVAHENGVPADNRAANVTWKTRPENHADMKRHGTSQRGERHGLHRLSEADVLAIRAAAARGCSQRSLAALYGVTQPTIGHVVRRKTWRHI